jgi:endo-1,4-beta-D-glucanase Y
MSTALAIMLMLMPAGCGGGSAGDPELMATLDEMWSRYEAVYIAPEGYVLDRRQSRVTSEGQSYALLRAVFMDDKATFDRVYDWTESALRRPDGLYAWLWDPDTRQIADANTATDADQDIALALILASWKFEDPALLERARELVTAIREETGVHWPGGWLPSAGNWAVDERTVNLSYFTPYAYEYFHRLDPQGDWLVAIESGYDLLARTMAIPEVRFPPDFQHVDQTGQPELMNPDNMLSCDFSFDAFRIYWRIAVDCRRFGRLRGCVEPAGLAAIETTIRDEGRLSTCYSVWGEALSRDVSPSFLGGLLPAFRQHAPALAEATRADLLDEQAMSRLLDAEDRYYDHNWVWFGLATEAGIVSATMPDPDLFD